ncbi:hypothetical protein [Paenibacillus flagellatus]|uniref:YgiT-type zinc finger protein n=1 Tax=Paenibacillus flagellatus TaxID=2211139 RepID=A0A2V5K981_9BACL|nr:hypothetical protein [Paenibacillus flagellatus]PYI54423.1 hypothetical protein DLM86_13205 [Paenibacillus flagellatus]
MQKPCNCGATMHIRLRTVIFQNKVEIENVPIYSCDDCHRSEVFPPVKPELTGYIRTLGPKPEPATVSFGDLSELAHLMQMATSKEHQHRSVESIVEDRVNELLDLLLLARSLEDGAWAENVRHRLTQITSHMTTTYRLS